MSHIQHDWHSQNNNELYNFCSESYPDKVIWIENSAMLNVTNVDISLHGLQLDSLLKSYLCT